MSMISGFSIRNQLISWVFRDDQPQPILASLHSAVETSNCDCDSDEFHIVFSFAFTYKTFAREDVMNISKHERKDLSFRSRFDVEFSICKVVKSRLILYPAA